MLKETICPYKKECEEMNSTSSFEVCPLLIEMSLKDARWRRRTTYKIFQRREHFANYHTALMFENPYILFKNENEILNNCPRLNNDNFERVLIPVGKFTKPILTNFDIYDAEADKPLPVPTRFFSSNILSTIIVKDFVHRFLPHTGNYAENEIKYLLSVLISSNLNYEREDGEKEESKKIEKNLIALFYGAILPFSFFHIINANPTKLTSGGYSHVETDFEKFTTFLDLLRSTILKFSHPSIRDVWNEGEYYHRSRYNDNEIFSIRGRKDELQEIQDNFFCDINKVVKSITNDVFNMLNKLNSSCRYEEESQKHKFLLSLSKKYDFFYYLHFLFAFLKSRFVLFAEIPKNDKIKIIKINVEEENNKKKKIISFENLQQILFPWREFKYDVRIDDSESTHSLITDEESIVKLGFRIDSSDSMDRGYAFLENTAHSDDGIRKSDNFVQYDRIRKSDSFVQLTFRRSSSVFSSHKAEIIIKYTFSRLLLLIIGTIFALMFVSFLFFPKMGLYAQGLYSLLILYIGNIHNKEWSVASYLYRTIIAWTILAFIAGILLRIYFI